MMAPGLEEPLDDKFLRTLQTVAPGTLLREGLDHIVRARTGALIVVGDGPEVLSLVDGGFRVDTELMPSYLYELAKMDGAIILTQDSKRILHANVQLVPDTSIPSKETGIRHRTAERVALQTGQLVIAISQRRSVITLYQGSFKYVLRDIGFILTKANQAIQTLSRYRAVLDQALSQLSALEFDDLVTLSDAVGVLHRAGMVLSIEGEIQRYIGELGTEGRLVSIQLDELMEKVEDQVVLVVRDYAQPGADRSESEVRRELVQYAAEDLSNYLDLARILGFTGSLAVLDRPLVPRGYRLLRRIPRLPVQVVDNLVARFGNLQRILRSSLDELDQVEGIGEARARAVQEGLRRLREQVMLERRA
ncbi:MAG: DNA integrity scanning diadenylate cyclase DisA [Acetobacteraceae bacterium]|nr:DNA integrity scanning diadenylate cyclase DisA [Acetobacteraceae bacterium]